MGDSSLLPQDSETDEDIARAWIAFERIPRDPNTSRHTEEYSSEYNALFWTFERITYLTEHLPHKAWRVILLIWSMDQSIEIMQNLSAGPVEDLLAKHGEEMIPLVEAEARRDPTFAKLLGGVWKNRMTDEVWSRLQRVWDRRGWDGNP